MMHLIFTYFVINIILYVSCSGSLEYHDGYIRHDHSANTENITKQIANICAELEAIPLLTQQIKQIQLENVNLKHRIQKLEQGKSKYEDTMVGFTAFATTFKEYHAGDVMLFDGIISNDGGWYNEATSIFLCPTTAYYMFFVKVQNKSPFSAYAELQMDGVGLACANSGDDDPEHDRSSSNLVITRCNSGEEVKVVSREDNTEMVGNNNRHSTFSGALLQVVPSF